MMEKSFVRHFEISLDMSSKLRVLCAQQIHVVKKYPLQDDDLKKEVGNYPLNVIVRPNKKNIVVSSDVTDPCQKAPSQKVL